MYLIPLTLVPLIILSIIGLFMGNLFEKAGKKRSEAYVPVLNVWNWLDIIGKPRWWFLVLFVPIINIITGFVMMLEMAKTFGVTSVLSKIAYLFLGSFLLPAMNFNSSASYVGPGGVPDGGGPPTGGKVES